MFRPLITVVLSWPPLIVMVASKPAVPVRVVASFTDPGVQDTHIATIDWAGTAGKGFPYMIRQEPGTWNALGQVKFIFPNSYSVYLHDTPSKGLFARTERAFSHGCIRTENPFDFAEHLLDNQGWDRARIDQVIASGKTTRVNLETPVTVMLLYWTADVAEDGTVLFKKDVYGRDAKIIAGLAEPFRVDPPEGIGE